MLKNRKEAIDLARWTLHTRVKEEVVTFPKLTDPYFNEKAGVFVTLKKNGMLRGCIGIIEPVNDLKSNIIESTTKSALGDWRFPKVTLREVSDIKIEISILSPFEYTSRDDIKIGEHGLIVEGKGKSAIYLPQVATEQGWTFDNWLTSLCEKAGLPHNFWKTEDARFKTCTADVFSEWDVV